VTKIITVTIVNLATPQAGAKHELLFNEPASLANISLDSKSFSGTNALAYLLGTSEKMFDNLTTRSSTINSIKRMLGLSPSEAEIVGHSSAASPLPQLMQFVPAPPQFMSPGAISNDSLMMMSPGVSITRLFFLMT
jgi:hypothetical protein